MKSIKKYIVLFPILLCLLFSICTPFIASAADYNFVFNISEPIVDNWTGYIIQPRSTYSNSSISCDLYFWVITPLGDYSLSFPTVNYFYTGSSSILQFSSSASDESYFCTVYATNSYSNGSGTVTVKDSFVINPNTSRDITLLKGSYDIFWRPQFKNVVSPDESWPSAGTSYTITWADDVAIYNELIEVNNNLTDLINNLDLTNEQLVQTYSLLSDYLSKINKNTNSLVALVDQFYYEWYQWSWTEQGFYERIIELLEQAIEGEKPSNQDSFQDSYDDYADIEQDLINNEEASNAIDDFDVSIEGGAYSVIWNMITDFLNSNSKVFGLFIACLTLAFIALLLHR